MIRAKKEIHAGSKALALGLLVATLMALALMLDAKPAHADVSYQTREKGATA